MVESYIIVSALGGVALLTIIILAVCVLCRRRRRERRRVRHAATNDGPAVTFYGTPPPYIIPQQDGDMTTAATMPLGSAGFPTPNLTVPIQPYVSTLKLPQSMSGSHSQIGRSSEYETEDSEKRRMFPAPLSFPRSSRRASTIPTTNTSSKVSKSHHHQESKQQKQQQEHVGGEIKSNTMAQSTEESAFADDESSSSSSSSSDRLGKTEGESPTISSTDTHSEDLHQHDQFQVVPALSNPQQQVNQQVNNNSPPPPPPQQQHLQYPPSPQIPHPLADHDFFERQQFPPASHEALQPIENLSSGNPFVRDSDFSSAPEFNSEAPSPSPNNDSDIPPRKPRRRRI